MKQKDENQTRYMQYLSVCTCRSSSAIGGPAAGGQGVRSGRGHRVPSPVLGAGHAVVFYLVLSSLSFFFFFFFFFFSFLKEDDDYLIFVECQQCTQRCARPRNWMLETA